MEEPNDDEANTGEELSGEEITLGGEAGDGPEPFGPTGVDSENAGGEGVRGLGLRSDAGAFDLRKSPGRKSRRDMLLTWGAQRVAQAQQNQVPHLQVATFCDVFLRNLLLPLL